MKNIKILAVCLLGFAIFAGCGGSKSDQPASTVQKVAVEIDKVKHGDITVSRTFSGTLEGARQSKVYAMISERVIEIPASEGDYVQAGQPLIILDKSGVSSQYNQAKALYLNSKDNYEKMERLYQQKAISEVDYKGAKTSFEVAEANFAAAKSSVELSVPINGVVTDISVNVGDQAPLGTAIATVANIENMRLNIYVGLSEIGNLRIGQVANVYIDSQNPIEAKISEISKSADPETRLFRIELTMSNSQNLLKPGMYAKAEIVVNNLINVLSVSRQALFIEDGISKVYIINNDTAYVRSIEIGLSDDKMVQVVSGLAEGQDVVIEGKSSLRDATPVILSAGEVK